MFRCHFCKKVIPPCISAVHVVIETREVQYPSRGGRTQDSGRKSTKSSKSHDPGGKGFEIAREVLACPSCAKAREKEEKLQSSAA